MPGDDVQLSTAEGGVFRARSGPRHAAPKKSLLTKFQIPAGKAIALAAMPTAVFMGMAFTPRLALAEDKDIPFAPGPCVTRSDEPTASESPSPSETPNPSPSATDDEQDDEPKPSPTPTPSESESETGGAGAGAGAADVPAPTPTPTPSETATKNPLDPLGLGDALKDLLDGSEKEPTASPTPSATATTEPSPTAEPSTTAEPTAKPSAKPTETVDEAKEAIKDAADKAGAEVEELDDDAKGLDTKKDEDIPDGAKPRFPCPTADPKALADAKLEPGRPLLPDDPWILESTLLTLNGLDYKGIVEVKTGSGKIKKVLKFTASSVDIKDLHQLVVGPNGTTAHVSSNEGSTSTIRNGEVTMYTEELKGNLFGLIPITFSPEAPPPLNVPFAFFTNVKVTQAGQFGGTLTVPGLHNYFTGK